MIFRTQHKLEEANFFLEQLRSEDRKVIRTRPKAFEFYLSAFLSAARSVTFALQKEAKDLYGTFFQKWLETLSQEDRDILEFMKVQRNFELKELGAKTETTEQAVPAELVPGFQVFWHTGRLAG